MAKQEIKLTIAHVHATKRTREALAREVRRQLDYHVACIWDGTPKWADFSEHAANVLYQGFLAELSLLPEAAAYEGRIVQEGNLIDLCVKALADDSVLHPGSD